MVGRRRKFASRLAKITIIDTFFALLIETKYSQTHYTKLQKVLDDGLSDCARSGDC